MNLPKTGTLRVPGASIYYEVHGSGPLLLIIQGGDGDAGGSAPLVDQLIEHYTVVVYDRRGLSRSTSGEGTPPPDIQTHGDDAHHLLESMTNEPVLVLGASIGALIGLDLAARYPHQVRALIAHEPPALPLLPDEERLPVVGILEETYEMLHRDGAVAANRKDMAQLRIDFNDREPDVVLPPSPPQRAANLQFFRKYDAPASHRYRPDIDALKSTTARIVFAVGRGSQGIWPYRATEILAGLLGTTPVEFPGGHNGFVLRPKAFASRLCEVLSELS